MSAFAGVRSFALATLLLGATCWCGRTPRAAEAWPNFPSFQRFSRGPSAPPAHGFGLTGPDLSDGASSGPSTPKPHPPTLGSTTGGEGAAGTSASGEDDPALLRRRLLDTLFDRLRKSANDAEAEGVAGAIERVWLNSGSDTADLLMSRALRAEHAEKYRLGVELLSKVVLIEPDWAEGWNELAIARALSNDRFGAMEDIAHALALEPRHFGALAGLGAILMESGDKKGALRVFRRVLELYPRLSSISSIVDRLTITVEGRDL